MSAPLTHDLLQSELAKLPTRDELAPRLAKLDALPTRDELAPRLAKLDALPTRDELAPRLAKLDALRTRDELEARFATLATKNDLERYATKVDLEGWGHAILDRMDRVVGTLGAEMQALGAEMRGMRIELSTDLTRHVVAMTDDLRCETRAVDEKYADLPDRVAALEKARQGS